MIKYIFKGTLFIQSIQATSSADFKCPDKNANYYPVENSLCIANYYSCVNGTAYEMVNPVNAF